MGGKQSVDITRAVLEWAISESGLTPAEVAVDIGVDESRLRAWLEGPTKPGLTELKHIARVLHRQVAVFLLPEPPATEHTSVQFRHPIGAKRSLARWQGPDLLVLHVQHNFAAVRRPGPGTRRARRAFPS